MNYSSVLIITYGRSGSTLLQGLLNSIEGCLVRGENHNFCYGLFLAYDSLCRARKEHGNSLAEAPTSPWFGAHLLNPDLFLEAARSLVKSQLVPSDVDCRCYGFKEIRYVGDHISSSSQLYNYLDFLRETFPNPAFVMLFRDLDQVVQSAWWRERDPTSAKAGLRAFENSCRDYALGKPWVHIISYEDIVTRGPGLSRLFDFLGAPYVLSSVERVLSIRHSYQSRPELAHQLIRVELPVAVEPVAEVFVDPDLRTGDNGELKLTGVVILRPTYSGPASLVAVDCRGEHEVEWGVPSPKFGKQFTDNPHSGNARFRVQGLEARRGEEVRLVLIDNQGMRHTVLTASIDASEPTSVS